MDSHNAMSGSKHAILEAVANWSQNWRDHAAYNSWLPVTRSDDDEEEEEEEREEEDDDDDDIIHSWYHEWNLFGIIDPM